MSRNKSKHRKKTKLTNPYKNSGQQDKRERTFNIHGTIEAQPPQSLIDQHIAERKEDRRRESNKLLIEGLTLLAVVVYAGLTAWQVCLTRNLVIISQKTFNAANRPYIGVNTFTTQYAWESDDGNFHVTSTPTTKSDRMDFIAEIKNFGPVPGTNYSGNWRVFVGDKEMVGNKKIPDQGITFFPGEMLYLRAGLRGADYQDIMRGNKRLTIDVLIEYDGPSGHYKECQKNQFQEQRFIDLGTC